MKGRNSVKKLDEMKYRAEILEKAGVMKLITSVTYFFDVILIILGVSALIINEPNKWEMFSGTVGLAIVTFLIVFVLNKSRRSKKK